MDTSESPAARAHRCAIEALQATPGNTLGIWTDAESYRGRGVVLVAIARPSAACVLQIPAAEYDGMWIAQHLLGIDLTQPHRPSVEELRQQHKRKP